MKTAIVHYWIVRMRGGEAVLNQLMNFHKEADVYTNVYDPNYTAELFEGRGEPKTTFVNSLPLAKRIYPAYMPIMPLALEGLDLNEYELVVSSESGPSKWALAAPGATHVCYAHSPMRYIWDQRHIYRKKVPFGFKGAFDILGSVLRYADASSAQRVDAFAANSSFIAARINKYYRRECDIIFPPVETGDLFVSREVQDYFLFVGQLVSYKCVNMAIEACRKLNKKLVIVGSGPEAASIERLNDPLIDYRGRVSRADLANLMSQCRALLFPGIEDFGLVPVEVLASGRPVIALGKGGGARFCDASKDWDTL